MSHLHKNTPACIFMQNSRRRGPPAARRNWGQEGSQKLGPKSEPNRNPIKKPTQKRNETKLKFSRKTQTKK